MAFSRLLAVAPQQSLTARLSLIIGVVALFATSVQSAVFAVTSRGQLEDVAGRALRDSAFQLSAQLERSMFERFREIHNLASLGQLRGADPIATRTLLEQLQSTYPDYAWIGLTDADGVVRAATGDLLVGADVSTRLWFQAGRLSPFAGSVHEAGLLADRLPQIGGEPLRFVDVAAPVIGQDGRLLGVLGAHLSWRWASQTGELLRSLPADQRGAEALVIGADGLVLLGPHELQQQPLALRSIDTALTGSSGAIVERWPDGKSYLVGYHQGRGYRDYPGLGWTVLVRQPVDLAFATIYDAEFQILLGNLLLAGGVSAVAWLLAARTVRPLGQIADAADRIRTSGTAEPIPIVAGADEISRLSASLDSLVRSQLADKAALATSNSHLERELEERRRAERRLCESQERLAGILDSAMDAIVTVDADQRVVLFNRAAEQMFGYRADEVSGLPLDLLLPVRSREPHRHHVAAFEANDERARPVHAGELFGQRRDGREFPIEASVSRITIDGQPLYTAIVRDISARRSLEAQFLQSQKLETVGRLAGGVAHDFNNLLTVIRGYAQLARESVPPDAAAQADLQEVLGAADRAAALTRQLLAFARQEPFAPRVADLNELACGTARLLSRLLDPDIELATELCAGPCCARVDAGQIEQVLLNLAVNGRDAMPGGGRLTITTAAGRQLSWDEAAARGLQPGHYSLVTVSDTGVGISPEQRPHLFEPFFTTKEAGRGTGLGLAICYSIVTRHGGAITFESTLGLGTTFYLHLPSAPFEPAQVEEVPPALPPGNETILLVEDDEAVRVMAERSLRAAGYLVVAAADGAEALELFDSGGLAQLDLVLTDTMMPRLDGPGLIAALRERQITAPALLMSGTSAGPVDLRKPFSQIELAQAVRRALAPPEGGRALATELTPPGPGSD